MGGLTIEIIFFILKIEKRNKIIVFDFQKVGAGAQKSGGAAALPAPPPPRSLQAVDCEKHFFLILRRTFDYTHGKISNCNDQSDKGEMLASHINTSAMNSVVLH